MPDPIPMKPGDVVVLTHQQGGRLFPVFKDLGRTVLERSAIASQQQFALEAHKDNLFKFDDEAGARAFIDKLAVAQAEYRRECFAAQERRSAAFDEAKRELAFLATGATMDTIGGNCPVQAEGKVDGNHFYFRARGDRWQFHVAPTDKDIFTDSEVFYYERNYGHGDFAAGWMPLWQAYDFIVEAIGLFRAREAVNA